MEVRQLLDDRNRDRLHGGDDSDLGIDHWGTGDQPDLVFAVAGSSASLCDHARVGIRSEIAGENCFLSGIFPVVDRGGVGGYRVYGDFLRRRVFSGPLADAAGRFATVVGFTNHLFAIRGLVGAEKA